jgi:hypothetical protein
MDAGDDVVTKIGATIPPRKHGRAVVSVIIALIK